MSNIGYAAGVILSLAFATAASSFTYNHDGGIRVLPHPAKDFVADNDAMEEKWGLHFYVPSALPTEELFPENGAKIRLFATAEACSAEYYYKSSENLSREVTANTFLTVPGRTDYSEGTVYKKGDLQKILSDNPELKLKLLMRAQQNATHCQNERLNGLKTRWENILERLVENPLQP